MKKFSLFLMALLLMGAVFATPITLKKAESAAKAYFTIYGNQADVAVDLAYTHYSEAQVPVFYVFNAAPTGFVMVAQ